MVPIAVGATRDTGQRHEDKDFEHLVCYEIPNLFHKNKASLDIPTPKLRPVEMFPTAHIFLKILN